MREATPEDDAAVGELLVDAFVSTYAQEMPEVVVSERRKTELRDVASRRKNGVVLVAEEKGEVVATVSLFKPGAKESEAWSADAACLRMMAIHPKHQGKGISAELVSACFDTAKSWQLKAVELHIRRGAMGLARMYERLGFLRVPTGDKDLLPEIYLEAYRREI